MSSNCLNKQTILNDPNCKSPYVDAVNAYISQMNKYCLEDNNIIQDSTCVDFINNYEYIYNTPLQQNLLNQATLACQKNTDPVLNDICINKYKYKYKPADEVVSTTITIPINFSINSNTPRPIQPTIDNTDVTSTNTQPIDNTNIINTITQTKQPSIDNTDVTTTDWVVIGIVLFFLVIIVLVIIFFIYKRKKNNINKLDVTQSKTSISPIIV